MSIEQIETPSGSSNGLVKGEEADEIITTDELRSWLAMWLDMKQLYDTQQYDMAVARFGADMVAHFNVDDIDEAILGVEAQLAARGAT